jgi:hypothetical protein
LPIFKLIFSDSTCSGVSKISYGFFLRGHLGQLDPQHDVNIYPHTIIYFVSCTLHLCGHYVASEMTNSKLVPKNTKFSKKYKIFQKSFNFPKKPKFSKKAKFWITLVFFWKFGFFFFFLKNLAFLANFGFFG